MRERFKWFLGFVLISSWLMAQQPTDATPLILEFDNESYKELTLSEWKKFKVFEHKLIGSQKIDVKKARQLSGYARDSIQILGVKLMAVKLLEEKKLLRKDIAENPGFYVTLVDELRKSGIPPSEYLFLEEKMAFLNLIELERQLGQSRWINAGLLVLCLVLGFTLLHFKFKGQKTIIPELSRQEVTVRNLILEGKSNKEIANELFISLSTVKTHITNLYAKLNVANRQELFQKSTGAST